MEATASRSFLLSLPYPFLGTNDPKITRNATPTLLSPAASLRGFNFGSKDLKPQRYLPSSCSSSKIQGSKPSHNFALLLEVEGVLADIYRLGNRQAFNVAFQKLGLDCANWTEPIYSDLARKAGGHEERMMILFFNRIGWPTSLPTNEKETFMKSILREKRKALEEFVESSSLPLQSGVENFIDEALSEGIPIVILTAYSQNGEKLARSVIEKLGRDRLSNIKIVGKDEVERSFYGQLVLGKGVSSSLDEQLAKEVQKAVAMEKRRIAEQVASVLKLSVDIDANPSESLEKVVATLRAGAEHGGFLVKDCVLITGSQSGVRGAESIGMPFVVLRNSLTARTEFESAKTVMEGFGGADLTIAKLLSMK